ncbi:MAG: hypothetical protein ACTSX4_02145 [Candidatus Helarchaeota archaeon]
MNNTKSLLLYFFPLFIFEVIVISYLLIFLRQNVYGELVPLIPGPMVSDILIMFLGIPLIIMVLGFLISPLITILYYGVHRIYRIFSKEHEYCTIEMKDNIPFKRLFYRLMFPAFFSLSLAMMFNYTNDVSYFLYIPGVPVLQIFMASLILTIPAFLLLAPLWILDDSGIICHLIEDIGYRRPPETESVSRFFSNTFKGYVSISFVISFVRIVLGAIADVIENLSVWFQFLLIPLIIGFPFLLSAFFVPFCILYEKWVKKLVSIMQKIARTNKLPHVEEKFIPIKKVA